MSTSIVQSGKGGMNMGVGGIGDSEGSAGVAASSDDVGDDDGYKSVRGVGRT
jgi:hypothetical protein